ncbi:hypothetical protein BWQ96_06496 [Gracilariopsis chorda]|uniref:Uncharacterized protein n=1 Tax=Gracilariopsis chorda TaxID=448386 RepID=A0A2V3INX2_9FLOR|nr:hypothetical protein BWQ96_06496 [Gracilariopsis chorda]|eukprot:PXF43764.1 hypothetical protein BWQ96_06496 [Gracilariopsis chorda]
MSSAAFVSNSPLLRQRRRSHAGARVLCSRHSPPTPPSTQLLSRLDALTERTNTVKCPFWRRRFTDTLDAIRQVLTWAILTRHKSILPSSLLPCAPTTAKTPNLPIDTCLTLIQEDFEKRQYYITGRLTTEIYRDDCLFDGPDPDVPVRGLQKYTSATAGLFCRRLSNVQLIHIQVLDQNRISAEWRLEGALNLPWKPTIKPYTGCTIYTFDQQRLVKSHVETWSVTALDAFVSVVFKRFGAPPAASIEQILEQRAASDPKQR